MKKLALLLLAVVFAGAATILVPFLIRHHGGAEVAGDTADKQEGKPKSGKAAAESDSKEPGGKEEKAEGKSDATVKLDKEGQQRVGIEVKVLVSVKLRPQIVAYGRAIDPAGLAGIDTDLVSAEAALQASQAASERSQTLFEANQNVSRKTVESAAAQFRADQSKVEAQHRRLALEWGTPIAALDDKARGALLDDLIKEKAAIVRVDVPGGESVKVDPTGAKVTVLGRESEPIPAASVAPAAGIDPKAQAQGFLLQISDPPFPVRAGVAVTAFLEFPGDETEGVIVPRSAIVRYAGEAWAYVRDGEDGFERRRVPAGQVTEDGWFVNDGLKPGDAVVVTAAQTLLSSEMTAQGGDAGD